MKTTINHLPANKQSELKHITEIIRQHTDDVVMVILFGSYARGEYKEEKDLAPDRKSGHASDYDILVVTSQQETVNNSELWQTINNKCQSQQFSATPRLIVHDIQELNIKLAQAHYFYTEITEEGCFLHNSNEFALAERRELQPAERKRLAQEQYDVCFTGAVDFYKGYKFYLSEKSLTKAAFSLNQATESSYKTILLVFNNYVPHEHYLPLLGSMAEEVAPEITGIFPRKTESEREQFRLLDYAYIGARYDTKFKIRKDQLESLALSVKGLLDITEKVCREKIKQF